MPLTVFSIFCFCQSLLILLYLSFLHFSGKTFPDIIYMVFVPILQVIFGIWTWKGRSSQIFSKAALLFRIPLFLYMLILYFATFYPSRNFHFSMRPILLLSTLLELTGIVLLIMNMSKTWWKETSLLPSLKRKWSFEEKNRLIFGAYMIGLGFFLLVDSAYFLQMLHFPAIENPKILNILALQIITLGIYNLISSSHGIKVLIEAGIHGGFFATIVFLILVLVGAFHPLALLIPMIDIISIILTIIRRFYTKERI